MRHFFLYFIACFVSLAFLSIATKAQHVQINRSQDQGAESISGKEPCNCSGKYEIPIQGNQQTTDTLCYYLYPYNLHLIPDSTTSVPLQILDQSGNIVTGDITFTGYNTSLISISADGYVTAKRVESSTEIGTWVTAKLNGTEVANACIVRVLSKDYNLIYTEETGTNTILYYPPIIKDEDISPLISKYQIPQALEYAYLIQESLMRLRPFGGCKQIFELDFGETEQQRVCGISGNPTRFGWNIAGNTWQNCFLVPFILPRSPQWGVIFHELGHNFTWASNTFAVGLGNGLLDYSEGFATIIGLATSIEIVSNPSKYTLTGDATASIKWVLNRDTTNYLSNFNNWVNNGAPFTEYNADLVDGLFLHYRQQSTKDLLTRLFLPLQPQYESDLSHLFETINTEGNDGKHTFFAALVSAAAGTDLSSEFINTYHFPIIQSLFDDLYQNFNSIIETVISVGQTTHFIPKEYCLEQNYPNPFNPATTIKYSIPKSGLVTIRIYDLLGREIATPINEYKTSGTYEIVFDASNLTSGSYFYQLQAGNFTETKKLVLIK